MVSWKGVSKRVLFAVFAIYLVVSITFGFVALTANPSVSLVAHQTAQQAASERANASEAAAMVNEAVSAYRVAHDLDEPVEERYVRWLVDIATLDWGRSHTQDAPVTAVLARTLPRTLAYVVPAMLFALLGGVGLGVYAGLRPGSLAERVVTGGVYLGYGLPNYWVANVVLLLGIARYGDEFRNASPWVDVVLPAAVLGVSLFAGQLRYARVESSEYVSTSFVKFVRSKGASTRRVARHVVRNAALPLLSLFFADLIGVLVVNVFVLEAVLDVRGIGGVGLLAIQQRDLPLVLGVAMVLAFVGVVGNLVQDLAYLVLDPRVEDE